MHAQHIHGADRDYKRGKQGDQRGPENNDRAVRMQSAAEILNFVAPGDIAQGTVVKVESFGAFIELDGCHGLHGLVHVSQMAKDRVDNAAEVVSTGDKVYVKVLSIEDGTGERPKPRVSLSMKYCSQSDGSDKDPNGILAEQEQRRKRTRREGTTVISHIVQYNYHSNSINVGI
jgi:ribosomal protein S1